MLYLTFSNLSAELTAGSVKKRTLLKGPIPPEVGLLSDMDRFLVTDNELNVPVEGVFTGWSKVTEIKLDENQLTGLIPNTFDVDNPLLEMLLCDDNRFTGEIPPPVCRLP